MSDSTSALPLAERIFRLYTRGLSYPVLLQFAPHSVPALVKEASTEAEFLPGAEPRQKLTVRLGQSARIEFIAYTVQGKSPLLSSGTLSKMRIDVTQNGRLVCAVLLEPRLSVQGGTTQDGGAFPTGVADYQPGLWESLFEEWDKQITFRHL